ncbi:MAG: ABC transporter ATP-binding protein [Coriobacteriaceae bacterium]|nr:ABC transporter ATP-binding protein [Coriobacteriaceae bacterium]
MRVSMPVGDDDMAIALKDVSVSYKGRVIFSNASLDAKRGDVIGFMGPNGAGKSTMLRVLAGLVIPRQGSGHVLGYPLGGRGHAPFGIMLETPPFIEEKTGRENLVLLSKLRGVECKDVHAYCAACMKTVGLEAAHDVPVKCYSQGMRKRLGWAQSLLGMPPLYLFDEPMNGLDPLGVVVLRNCIRKLSDRGAVVVVSSHLLAELERVCTKVYMFNDGAVFPVTSQGEASGWLERVYVNSVLGKEQ